MSTSPVADNIFRREVNTSPGAATDLAASNTESTMHSLLKNKARKRIKTIKTTETYSPVLKKLFPFFNIKNIYF